MLRGKEFITEEFTVKDPAAAVTAMYTFNFDGGGRDVRQELVQAAELCAGLEEGGGEKGEWMSKKDERIKGVRDALCLVMAALRKLPGVGGV